MYRKKKGTLIYGLQKESITEYEHGTSAASCLHLQFDSFHLKSFQSESITHANIHPNATRLATDPPRQQSVQRLLASLCL